MNVEFTQLITPTVEIAQAFDKWDNDPALVPLIRPCQNQTDLEVHIPVCVDTLTQRLEHCFTYLIYVDEKLVGAMTYQADFDHLYKKEAGTAWIGIVIGEGFTRNKGLGTKALAFLERQIKLQGLKRIELGVFAFNKTAIKLYKNCDYQEIGRIKDFTFWQDKMWTDIRFEKYL